MQKNESLLELRKTHIPQATYNSFGVFIKNAQGAIMTAIDDREYIDFTGGIGVNNVGHCHPRVVEAIQKQSEKFIHTCFHVALYEPYLELAVKLNEVAPGKFSKMTMFTNSGAEAVENAVKVVRYAKKRPAIVCFENAFHGRTLLGMTLTSKVKPIKFGFGPMATDVYRLPFAYCYRCSYGLKYPDCGVFCAERLKNYFKDNVDAESIAAVIAEPIQGEGGFITPPPEFFPKIEKICKENDIALIIDEVQSGVGRTGKFFAIEHWGIEPDLITTAKSLAGGMPLGAVTGRQELMNAPPMGALGATFGGNPVSCCAGLAVMDILYDDGVLDKSKKLGELILGRFQAIQKENEIIGEVRGKGPMLALELVKDRETKEPATDEVKKIAARCFEKGLMILTTGAYANVIRVLMPLVINNDQLDSGLQILEESIREIG